MLCADPFRKNLQEFACGKCDRCLSYRRKVWTARIVLESLQHASSGFFTLTYKEMPKGYVWKGQSYADGSVSRPDVTEFLKRLRYFAEPLKLRYFGVGEYGSNGTQRPHYHIALFGSSSAALVGRAWTSGFVHSGMLTPASAAYVVSYVLKRWTYPRAELRGRYPEFPFMSLKPGLGAGATPALVKAVMSACQNWTSKEDMPKAIRGEGRMMPLGRYLVDRVSSELGLARGVVVPELVKEAAQVGTSAAVEAREGRRLQHARNARIRKKISLSKGSL